MELAIDLKKLGISKTKKVETTQANYRKSAVLMRDMTQIEVDRSGADPDDPRVAVKILESQIQEIDTINAYLKDILGLSTQDMKALENQNQYKIFDLAYSLIFKIMGISEDKATDADLKSDAE